MKQVILEKIKTKYNYFIFLSLYICILLFVATYDAKYCNKDLTININGSKIDLDKGILDDKYISREDLLEKFSNNIYYDKVSRKLIITTWDNILKIGNEDVILQNETAWYGIETISSHFGLKTIRDIKQNSICVYNNEEIDAYVIKNRTEVYNQENLKVIGTVDSNDKINVILDENVLNRTIKYVTVKISLDSNKTYFGLIEKSKLRYELEISENSQDKNKKILMTNVVDKIYQSTDLDRVTDISVEMLRISSENNIIEEEYTLKKGLKQNIYAVITNGYKSASFDSDILSRLVSSNKNKEEVTDKINKYLIDNNLKGLVIDFKNFKVSDKEMISQYIKELAVVLHKNDKSVIIKMNSVLDYNLDMLKHFVDYVIVQAHGFRTTSSKISGSHSPINEVKKLLNQFVTNINCSKLIVELAPYSILWTEKFGVVINAEVYSMDACTQYIKANNLTTTFDEVSAQNLINYTKGVINYKMWIEDKTSIEIKSKLAKEMNFAGITIYRSGYESKEIYAII